ncbi:diguanylate cyclase [Leucobacter sp. wl10]|uniref:GGDEF domain-containing protein n=1 Tax=Leucobacter sp. wl10 TaxID=2304677 RepID=UPI000E5AA91A|nr:GGDEF domain-containing protein [Leucobacter sp. wl10]RGE24297.1 GGDEF domain-containing protein [Leucobacter sp. wl10]
MDRRQPRSPSPLVRGIERVRSLGVGFVRWQTPFSFVSAMISLLPALVSISDLVIGHPGIDRIGAALWVALCLVGVLVPLALGRRHSLWFGMLVVVGVEASSSYFLLFAPPGHGEINALLTLPFSALYIGWFFPTAVAVTFMVLSMLRVCMTLIWNPDMGSGVGSPLILVSYAVLISVFTFGGARAVRKQVRMQAAIDPLTGVLNRRGLGGAARRLRERALRRDLPVSIAIIDFDDFKLVNDVGGHAAGDAALRESASAWKDLVGMRGVWSRDDGIVARIGGDEFTLLLQGDMDELEARLRLWRADSQYAWSWGVASVRPGEGLDAALARADLVLYRAKQYR